MSKREPGLSSNAAIREAIQKIALHGVINPKTNSTYTNEGVSGYVVKVHLDDELAGTVDVKEYNNAVLTDEEANVHEGVLLSAIQGNTGLLVVPKLYSDVLIMKDPVTNLEYVTMFSHVDIIQLDSHTKVTIGVTEREDFDDSSEDGNDINELEATGIHAVTTYEKDSIVTEVTDGEDNIMTETLDTEKHEIVAGDDKTIQTIEQDGYTLEHGDGKMTMDDDGIILQHDQTKVTMDGDQILMEKGSKIKIEQGKVYLGDTSNTDDAVLGAALADVLSDIVGYLAAAQTTTMMGPQPLLTKVPDFIAMKAKISAWKAAHSGFLTNKVLIQK